MSTASTTAENMKNGIRRAYAVDTRNISSRPRVFPSKNFKMYFSRGSSFWTSWINSFFSFLLIHTHIQQRGFGAYR